MWQPANLPKSVLQVGQVEPMSGRGARQYTNQPSTRRSREKRTSLSGISCYYAKYSNWAMKGSQVELRDACLQLDPFVTSDCEALNESQCSLCKGKNKTCDFCFTIFVLCLMVYLHLNGKANCVLPLIF